MANNTDKGAFWPWLILGFIFIGLLLGYWTVRSAISLPVHEANEFMQKYQLADIHFNRIQEQQEKFDARYRATIEGLTRSDFEPKNLKRKEVEVWALKPVNTLTIAVTTREGQGVDDANVSVLLTRPFTQKEDQKFEHLSGTDGRYVLRDLKPGKPGRYLLYVRVQVGDAVGYFDREAYLKPSE
jgi:uncharacterized protein YdcH (DUF465 family)